MSRSRIPHHPSPLAATLSPHRPGPSVSVRQPRGVPRLILGIALAAGLAGTAVAADDSTGATPEQRYQLALESRTERDYPAMLTHLREAANGGDQAAQELLVSVLLAGPRLSGGAIAADPCEAARWADRAATQGSAVARHQLRVLNAHRDGPGGRAACAAGPG